jgi:hypothetical protein
MLEELFPESQPQEPSLDDNTLRGESFISIKRDGAVY